MRAMKLLSAAALMVAVAVVVAVAQPPGGFGGGFGGGGFGGGPSSLVTIKAVQEDLKMTEEQATKVGEWAKGFFTKRMEIMKDKGVDFGAFGGGKGGGKGGGGAGGFGKVDPEVAAKMAAANAEADKVAYKELESVLKPDQIKRLRQIDIQRAGVTAFQRDDVVTAVKITDQQKSSIKGIVADFQKDQREIQSEMFGGGKGGGGKGGFDAEKMAATQAKITKLQKEAIGKVVELLDDTQKTAWKELNGPAFDLTKLTQPPRKKD